MLCTCALLRDVHVHCSCQFVVSASGDYSIHSGDPDRLVEWDRIQQVVRIIMVCIPTCMCLSIHVVIYLEGGEHRGIPTPEVDFPSLEFLKYT